MTSTTTGIRLSNEYRTGDWVVTQPGKPDIRLTHTQAGSTPFDAARKAAGLHDGYWVRDGQYGGPGARNEFTWM